MNDRNLIRMNHWTKRKVMAKPSINSLQTTSMVVLSFYFRDKCSLLDDDEKRHSNSHREPSKYDISYMLILLILHFKRKVSEKSKNSVKKLIKEMRNQYMYQLCTRYHIDYNISARFFTLANQILHHSDAKCCS